MGTRRAGGGHAEMGEWGSDQGGPEQSQKRTVITASQRAVTGAKKATKAPRSRATDAPDTSRVRAKRTLPTMPPVSAQESSYPGRVAAWSGTVWDQPYGEQPATWETEREDTLVTPALTLPPVSRRRADTEARALARRLDDASDSGAVAPRDSELSSTALAPRQPMTLGVRERKARVRSLRAEGVDFIPGRKLSSRFSVRLRREGVPKSAETASFIRRHKTLILILAMITIASITAGTATGTFSALNTWANPDWSSINQSQIAPTPTPLPAPDITDAAHYVAKYGFDYPRGSPITGPEFTRLVYMLPFAYSATAAFDRRYNQTIEPEMLLWWTHSEGIGGHINYSNCANHPPIAGQNYFTNIQNCSQANFWQLGFGNQFSVIYVLKNAFRDTHGDPNDAKLVQQVGQWVLNYDMSQGTVPKCGGYSCTFPTMTIDQIMSGVNETTGVVTADNWWASVLSRDPAINVYMIAQALTFFNHEATKKWIGCYYYEPCWGYESNNLGDVLASWGRLKQAAHIS
jgi:hypothetical protein